MELDKSTKHNYCGYYGGKENNDSIYFNNGKLEASTHSYEIDGVGTVELTEKQTLEIYKQMKKYFERDLLE